MESDQLWLNKKPLISKQEDITGGTSDYVVKIHPEWLVNPQCSCPDAEQRAKESARGYCKHIIAVLLSNEEFRCQLLEAFL